MAEDLIVPFRPVGAPTLVDDLDPALHEVAAEWLPRAGCSGRITDTVVIDLGEARKRLRAEERVFGPPPIQATLALADEMRRQLESGVVNNQAGLAHLYGFTRARVTQLLNLHRLHPNIVAFLRGLAAGPHAPLYTERRVRELVGLDGDEQLVTAGRVLPGYEPGSGGCHWSWRAS